MSEAITTSKWEWVTTKNSSSSLKMRFRVDCSIEGSYPDIYVFYYVSSRLETTNSSFKKNSYESYVKWYNVSGTYTFIKSSTPNKTEWVDLGSYARRISCKECHISKTVSAESSYKHTDSGASGSGLGVVTTPIINFGELYTSIVSVSYKSARIFGTIQPTEDEEEQGVSHNVFTLRSRINDEYIYNKADFYRDYENLIRGTEYTVVYEIWYSDLTGSALDIKEVTFNTLDESPAFDLNAYCGNETETTYDVLLEAEADSKLVSKYCWVVDDEEEIQTDDNKFTYTVSSNMNHTFKCRIFDIGDAYTEYKTIQTKQPFRISGLSHEINSMGTSESSVTIKATTSGSSAGIRNYVFIVDGEIIVSNTKEITMTIKQGINVNVSCSAVDENGVTWFPYMYDFYIPYNDYLLMIKANGEWKSGQTRYKKNGVWQNTKIYIKVNDLWWSKEAK